MPRTVNLGDLVRCQITGLEGVVTSYSENITGCDRVYVQPSLGKDGKSRDGYWVDTGVVKIMKAGKVKPSSVASEKPGGPMSRDR